MQTNKIFIARQKYINNIIPKFSDNTLSCAIKNTGQNNTGQAFAPSNIALIKYWGKQDLALNQPTNDSISISLNNLGARTKINIQTDSNITQDIIFLNKQLISPLSSFAKRLTNFLNLFRANKNTYFIIDTKLNIPMGCGVASSACGFAALTQALNNLFNWDLPKHELSKIAQIGSGSAARSFWNGFVHWHAEPKVNTCQLPYSFPDLRIGLCILSNTPKKIGSTEAMLRTQKTSALYNKWPEYAQSLINPLTHAIKNKNFDEIGEISEECAVKMHELIHSAKPKINYDLEATRQLKQKVQLIRKKQNIKIYFTQDAGPNIKILFLEQDNQAVSKLFPGLIIPDVTHTNIK